jgi:hypothetical protein
MAHARVLLARVVGDDTTLQEEVDLLSDREVSRRWQNGRSDELIRWQVAA